MTKKEFVLTVLLFGSIWGAAEAVLGGTLHRCGVPFASVPLTIIALGVLTVARAYCPRPGASTLIASVAMLFKFANAPFWACHLLGILLLGAAYDAAASALGYDPARHRMQKLRGALLGIVSAYLGFALFALLITYVARYPYWVAGGPQRVLNHIFVAGSLAALGGAIVVPLAAALGTACRSKDLLSLDLRSKLTAGGLSLLIAALWVVGVTIPF